MENFEIIKKGNVIVEVFSMINGYYIAFARLNKEGDERVGGSSYQINKKRAIKAAMENLKGL